MPGFSNLFPADAGLVPCSQTTCSAGHTWTPTIATTKCPGCQAPLLVLKMVNCPVCNEPSKSLRLRADHLPHGGTVVPACKGSASLAEVLEILIDHGHAEAEQSNHVDREVVSKV
jgi:hypothetical protein